VEPRCESGALLAAESASAQQLARAARAHAHAPNLPDFFKRAYARHTHAPLARALHRSLPARALSLSLSLSRTHREPPAPRGGERASRAQGEARV
jgi:hypothetical protein